MAAKKIQVSDNSGTNYYTLPGSSGGLTLERATVNDTVFGQNFASMLASLGQWSVTANAYFKGVVGYIATIKKTGTATTMTSQAMSLVSGKTYQISDPTKRVISFADSLNVFDNGVDQTANVISIDYLSGLVTFASGYAVTGPVTITGKYLPLVTVAKAKSFTLTQTAAEEDASNYDDARTNGGWKTIQEGLKTVSLELGGIYNVANGSAGQLAADTVLVIQISPDNTTDTVFSGFFMMTSDAQAGNVGAIETETLRFDLWVPATQLLVSPFNWYLTNNSNLNIAVKKVITAWLNSSNLNVNYLPDGGTTTGAGQTGVVIVTECTLSNTMEGQNEFKCTFRGTGAPTAV